MKIWPVFKPFLSPFRLSDFFLYCEYGSYLVVSPENGEISNIETNKFSDMSVPPIVVNNNLYVISDNGELTSYR